ncbi:hypothetical protein H0H92_009363, partial [Tricholoma furcatifolium]
MPRKKGQKSTAARQREAAKREKNNQAHWDEPNCQNDILTDPIVQPLPFITEVAPENGKSEPAIARVPSETV